MPRTISNQDDTIDSRDVIARISELRDECGIFEGDTARWTAENPADAAELAALESLSGEAEGYAPDWHHGETLIRYSYFTDYAMEMLSDSGALPRDLPEYIVIDEEATALNIRTDYTAVEFGDVTYWIR